MGSKASNQITVVDITDAYSVFLTRETYVFEGNSLGVSAGASCSTDVVAYCGSELCTKITIGTITCPTGIKATITNNKTQMPTITFTTTDIVAGEREAIIPVTVDGATINKKFSFAVAKSGDTGTGANIIKNGYGEYLDNTNFTGSTYTRGDCPDGCYGYFNGTGTTEIIPFDKNAVYDIELYVRLHSGVSSGNSYFGIEALDVDGNSIKHHHVLNYNSNLFYLAKELKAGDTVVYFKDLTNWNVETTNDYPRAFLFFGYADSTGYVYPDGTYSRYAYTNIYKDNSAVNKISKTITLKSAWTGRTFAAGTCVGQVSVGSSYCYYAQSGTVSNTDWKRKTDRMYAGTTNGYDMTSLSRRLLYAKNIRAVIVNDGGVADYAKLSLVKRAGTPTFTPQYYLSTSKTSATGGSWSDTAPTAVNKGKYLWTRIKVTYTNPERVEYTTPAYESLAESRIEQLRDSITLAVTGADGKVSEIKMDDEGKIKLTGDVMADRITVAKLLAKDITATGKIQFDNGKYSLLIDETTKQIRLESWAKLYLDGSDLVLNSTGGNILMSAINNVAIDGYTVRIEGSSYRNSSWRTGRDNAALTISGPLEADEYAPALSMPTENGTWDIGTYGDTLWASYITNENYDAGNNTRTARIAMQADNRLYVPGGVLAPTCNNLIYGKNEFNFVPDSYSANVNVNYRTLGGTNGAIQNYKFWAGDGATMASVHAAAFYPGGTKMTDYIIDNGTSGIWNYQKYTSRRVIFWARVSVTSAACTTALGNWYRTEDVVGQTAWPMTLAGVPSISVNFGGDDIGALAWHKGKSTTEVFSGAYLVRPTSATLSGYVYIQATGWWK